MSTERLLVVDDDPAILTLCHRILEADGYTVVDAKRGEDALTKLESERFDLLLTDIRLPGLNGLDVTQKLRERGLEMTVVTMTGYSNMEMAIQALSLGVEEFVVKPFTPESLRVHVSRALEKSRLRRENLRLRTLVPLLQTAQVFAAVRTREQVFQELFAATKQLLDADEMFFLAANRENELATIPAAHGAQWSALRDVGVNLSAWQDARSFFSDQVQVWSDKNVPRLPFDAPLQNWIIAAPLRVRENALGVLTITLAQPPIQSDLDALHLIAAQAALALENVDLISEISHAYINVREAERLKSEFINIAAHELRTPLAIIRGYASLLRDQLKDEPRGYVEQVLQCTDRLQHIADDMLDLKYLESGHVNLQMERCAVDQVVREVVNSYRPLASEREQSIELALDHEAGDLMADRAMLDVMLGSLISNALKFSPRSSQVRVAAQGDTDHVTLIVQDQGKGLTPEQAEHVFEPFYQAGNSLTRQEGGMGLGLTLARKMVNAHGGKIWVESQFNHGSSFFISLPREKVEAENGN